jgi:hypothetical protein
MAGRFLDVLGTTYNKLQLGIDAAALNIKAVSNKVRARNKADSADAPLVGSVIAASGDFLELNEDAAGSGADYKMTLARPATGMSAAVTLTFPATAGTAAQALTTDGSGVLNWTTIAAGTDKVVTDTTSVAFGSTSPTAMFTLPANAVVSEIAVVVDTSFNGTPSLSVGITGTLSKYLSSTQVDLTQPATTTFEIQPGMASVGTTEAIIFTYAAGGASAGAARILVSYSIPS